MKGTRIAAMALSGVLMSAVFATPALAGVKEDAPDSRTGTVLASNEEETVVTASRIGDDINAGAETSATVTSAAGQTVEDESPALTPEGNMRIVDDIVTDGGKQFITLTTRGGHYYYLIIDRSSTNGQNVYFLNQVDERDLMSVMSDEDKRELEEENQETEDVKTEPVKSAEKADNIAENVASSSEINTDESADKPESATSETKNTGEKSRTIQLGNLLIPVSTILITGVFTCAALFAAAAFIIRKRRERTKAEPDPDADYEDVYDDEYILEEDDETEDRLYDEADD